LRNFIYRYEIEKNNKIALSFVNFVEIAEVIFAISSEMFVPKQQTFSLQLELQLFFLRIFFVSTFQAFGHVVVQHAAVPHQGEQEGDGEPGGARVLTSQGAPTATTPGTINYFFNNARVEILFIN
jgi:hypothetical protein